MDAHVFLFAAARGAAGPSLKAGIDATVVMVSHPRRGIALYDASIRTFAGIEAKAENGACECGGAGRVRERCSLPHTEKSRRNDC